MNLVGTCATHSVVVTVFSAFFLETSEAASGLPVASRNAEGAVFHCTIAFTPIRKPGSAP